jgi:hypothetical protein
MVLGDISFDHNTSGRLWVLLRYVLCLVSNCEIVGGVYFTISFYHYKLKVGNFRGKTCYACATGILQIP